jgi:hypothetical protein
MFIMQARMQCSVQSLLQFHSVCPFYTRFCPVAFIL